MTKPTAEDELCRQCGQPVTLHGYGSDCRLFVGTSSTAGAERERAAVVAMLKKRSDGYYRQHLGDAAMAIELAIAAIERGDHHKGKD